MSDQHGFNLGLWHRFAAISRPYWRESDERWRALGLLCLLMLLLVGQTGFNLLFNEESGEFTSALAAGDAQRFWASIQRFVLILLGGVPVFALYYFVRDTLGLRWRRWLTAHTLQRYLSQQAFYRLRTSQAQIDNPDQRISEDINAFTQQSLYFAMVVLGAVIQLAAFTGVLWRISQGLVHVLLVYALLASLITGWVFGRRLIRLQGQQLQKEADFRFGLVRLREQAEPIALLHGEPPEQQGLLRRFDLLASNYRLILRGQLRLNLFQYAHSFLSLALPSIVLAEQVLSGQMEVGRAVQAAGAFAAILSALTVIVEHFESLSRFGAGVYRLHAFWTSLSAPPDPAAGQVQYQPAMELSVEHLGVRPPEQTRWLVQDLTLTVPMGSGLMIVGPSGSGKSALLRTLAGLWPQGTGRIKGPAAPDLMVLPQQPYLPLLSLREQLLYPHGERDISNAELQLWLDRVNLSELPRLHGGWDSAPDWAKLLSVGEQQRLAFARALLARPRYLLLDEATSALDAENEARLYAQLAPLSITPISVSHRDSLLRFHQQVLTLTGDGAWRLEAARNSAAKRLDDSGKNGGP